MAGKAGPRLLKREEFLYRVVEPDFWTFDPNGPTASRVFPVAFEDPHIDDPETLSFFVKGVATPSDALAALSKRRKVRERCGSGKKGATPEQMYDAGYRIAIIPGSVILDIVQSSENDLEIKDQGSGDHVSPSGHLEIIEGHKFSATWGRHAEIISKEKTCGK